MKATLKIVWLVANYPNNINPVRGVFYKRMGRAICALDSNVELHVIAPTPFVPFFLKAISKKWKDYSEYPHSENYGNLIIYRPRYFAFPFHQKLGLTDRNVFRGVIDCIKKIKPEIIDAHYAYPFGKVASIIKQKLKIPYTVTFRGDDVNLDPFITLNGKQNFLDSVIDADELIAVSESLAKNSKKLINKNVTVLNIGLNFKEFDGYHSQMQLKQELQIPNNHKIVLYIGELIENKGIRELSESIQELSEEKITFIIIGGGPLDALLINLSNVKLTGRVSSEIVRKYLGVGDILVLPSYTEGMPNVLKEAGITGVPVIATKVGGIPDLLGEDERGYLIDKKSSIQLTEKIKYVVQHYDEALLKASNLKKYITEHFDIHKNAEELLAIYKKIIDNK
jgi:teichuronic acid biosynthesis glycosyltransferase TuaC